VNNNKICADRCFDAIISLRIFIYGFSEVSSESKDRIIGNDVFRFRNLDELKHYHDSTIYNNSV